MKKILIMGLPGSGKTTLATNIIKKLEANNIQYNWYNADNIRKLFEDWDFSQEGRLRQAVRMGEYADKSAKAGIVSLCDFVCPTAQTRELFGSADLIIWMDTILEGRYEDTNKMFEAPNHYDLRIRSYNDAWGEIVADMIINQTKPKVWDNRAPTVQLLGRFQPWHDGHQALFERALAKTGQVCIEVRDCQDWNDSNPFDAATVEKNIHAALETKFYGQYRVMLVPNIVNITYGRSVGYTIEQETFNDSIHAISATEIRKKMGFDK